MWSIRRLRLPCLRSQLQIKRLFCVCSYEQGIVPQFVHLICSERHTSSHLLDNTFCIFEHSHIIFLHIFSCSHIPFNIHFHTLSSLLFSSPLLNKSSRTISHCISSIQPSIAQPLSCYRHILCQYTFETISSRC